MHRRCAQDTPSLRALGSKWARLLDNLPDVSQLLRCGGCLRGQNLWDKSRRWRYAASGNTKPTPLVQVCCDLPRLLHIVIVGNPYEEETD